MKFIGGTIIVLFLVAACSNAMSDGAKPGSNTSFDSTTASSASSSDTGDTSAPTSGDCESSIEHTNQAFKDFEAGDYSGGYKNANSAVHLADACSDADMPSAKGFALSARAFNEHHLSVGDSTTDMNQATQLLADCQTQPAYYGTHQGALCETQEENDISTKMNWDMQAY